MTGRLQTAARRVDPRVVDVVPAVALCALGQFSIWAGYTREGPKGVTVPVALVVTLALAFRRRWPLAVCCAVMGAWSLQSIVATPPSALWELVVVLITAYVAGAHADGRQAVAGLVVNVAGITVITAFDNAADASFFTPIVFGVGPWLAGRLVRRQWSQARQLDALNAELEARRAEDVRVATQHERARIARELHDVVAHSISVMVVQAGAAERVIEADPDRAVSALASIRSAGKAALGDMRRLLGVLRTEIEEPGLGPQPGLDDLPALVERMRRAGLNAHLLVEGGEIELQPGPGLAAYRIVQEALTNTLKHGGRTSVEVTVRHAAEHVELQVLDEGGAAEPSNGSGGHGLIGMRERISLYGGTVEAGPREQGGWAVLARLPVDSPAAS